MLPIQLRSVAKIDASGGHDVIRKEQIDHVTFSTRRQMLFFTQELSSRYEKRDTMTYYGFDTCRLSFERESNRQ